MLFSYTETYVSFLSVKGGKEACLFQPLLHKAGEFLGLQDKLLEERFSGKNFLKLTGFKELLIELMGAVT